MLDTTNVLFDEMGGLGIITLNRPHSLNALTLEMTICIHQQLNEWALNKRIKAVIIKAVEGKAFCAGGDIRQVYEQHKLSDLPPTKDFFWHEYQLNHCIYHYPKPYIALLNGITMGGGAGISLHGSHRVATENFIFAMPETGIGFFPDVGATFFLPRCPDETGIFLGLTGTRINAGDALGLKFITHYVESAKLPVLLDALSQADFSNDLPNYVVTNVINNFTSEPEAPVLKHYHPHINVCFSNQTIENILMALETHRLKWCHEIAAVLKTKSPTSLKVTLRALRHGALFNFDQCIQTEYRIAKRFLQQHDFYEGVRAVIIDKHKQPVWQPTHLNEISESEVEAYFLPFKNSSELALAS